jgi:hypothetical protein
MYLLLLLLLPGFRCLRNQDGLLLLLLLVLLHLCIQGCVPAHTSSPEVTHDPLLLLFLLLLVLCRPFCLPLTLYIDLLLLLLFFLVLLLLLLLSVLLTLVGLGSQHQLLQCATELQRLPHHYYLTPTLS